MSRVWEDTIVTALRDAQWLNCRKDGLVPASLVPSGFLKLDGPPESGLGDVLYSAAERYYLIEVKGRRAAISSEWRGAKGSLKKLAYKQLASMWTQLEILSSGGASEIEKNDRDRLSRFFISSFAAHHFAYWDEWDSSQGRYGEIVLESYVPACARLCEDEEDNGEELIRLWPKNYFGFLHGNSVDGLTSEVIGLSDIFLQKRPGVCLSASPDNVGPTRPIGLALKDFQTYVNMLLQDSEGNDESLFAVVLSDSGSFFRVVGSTKELRLLMDPRSELYSSPRKKRNEFKSYSVGKAPANKMNV